MTTKLLISRLILLIFLFASFNATSQISISHRPANNIVVFGNSKLMLTLDYNEKCCITKLDIRSKNVASVKAGERLNTCGILVNKLIAIEKLIA